jgi:hypothetical protein
MAVSFKDLHILQINKDECAFSGNIQFLEPVGEPWKVNIILYTLLYIDLWAYLVLKM